jgi:hypothetical protein
VPDMALHENLPNERLDTVDKKHCSSSRVTVIIDRSQQQQKKTRIENMARVPDMSFHENSFNKPEIHFSLSKVPLTSAWSQQNFILCR